MNRKEFIQKIEKNGCVLLRYGARHDIYWNPTKALKQPIPRHTEMNDILTRHIWKELGLEEKP